MSQCTLLTLLYSVWTPLALTWCRICLSSKSHILRCENSARAPVPGEPSAVLHVLHSLGPTKLVLVDRKCDSFSSRAVKRARLNANLCLALVASVTWVTAAGGAAEHNKSAAPSPEVSVSRMRTGHTLPKPGVGSLDQIFHIWLCDWEWAETIIIIIITNITTNCIFPEIHSINIKIRSFVRVWIIRKQTIHATRIVASSP